MVRNHDLPPAVSNTAASHQITDIFATFLRQCFSESLGTSADTSHQPSPAISAAPAAPAMRHPPGRHLDAFAASGFAFAAPGEQFHEFLEPTEPRARRRTNAAAQRKCPGVSARGTHRGAALSSKKTWLGGWLVWFVGWLMMVEVDWLVGWLVNVRLYVVFLCCFPKGVTCFAV